MAEAILSVFVKTMLGNLNSLLLQELESAWGVKKELGKLESTLSTIHAVFRDAEEQQLKNEALKNWLKRFKDAAYVGDDLIDEFAIEAFRRNARIWSAAMNRDRGDWGEIRCHCSREVKVPFERGSCRSAGED
ncbi:putative disease resistance protein RGA4 [Magnolia sinica]|uniref:putative disease resistance protein RGA4 n=1 Tax=Magnolia sinica TaxID=86752 RepID=UPI0026599B2D|nr:putative disease resistance protein RGA4 [Magnolia sinica]